MVPSQTSKPLNAHHGSYPPLQSHSVNPMTHSGSPSVSPLSYTSSPSVTPAPSVGSPHLPLPNTGSPCMVPLSHCESTSTSSYPMTMSGPFIPMPLSGSIATAPVSGTPFMPLQHSNTGYSYPQQQRSLTDPVLEPNYAPNFSGQISSFVPPYQSIDQISIEQKFKPLSLMQGNQLMLDRTSNSQT